MNEKLEVSISPHIKAIKSTPKIMWTVILALLPAGIAGVYIFGIRSLYVILVSILSACLAEGIVLGLRRKKLSVLLDGSAVLTGLLLAYNLPPGIPLWVVVAGAAFGIVIGKQIFGGLGHNIFNPALVGRAFCMLSWPLYMTTWQNPRWWPDAITTATPLHLLKFKKFEELARFTNWDLFIGNRGGCIGEVCIIALLLGAAILFIKRYITWHAPITYIGTVALLSFVFGGRGALFTGDILFYIFSGGLILGAFFMATDYVTTPVTPLGKILFGVGCGILTVIIRKYSGYPEGVSYAILIMNAAAPILDRHTRPRWLGYRRPK